MKAIMVSDEEVARIVGNTVYGLSSTEPNVIVVGRCTVVRGVLRGFKLRHKLNRMMPTPLMLDYSTADFYSSYPVSIKPKDIMVTGRMNVVGTDSLSLEESLSISL